MAANTVTTTRQDIGKLPASVEHRLSGLAARLRRLVLIEGVAWLVGFVLVALAVQFLLDYSTNGLRKSIRLALMMVVVMGTGWVTWRRVVSLVRLRAGTIEAAHLVERHFPQLGSALVSAVRFAHGEVGPTAANSPALVQAVIDDAALRLQPLQFEQVLNAQRAKRASLALVGMLAACAVVPLASPELLSIWFARNILLHDVRWPQRTSLALKNADKGIFYAARGDDVVIEAYAQGVQPRQVDMLYETESGVVGSETMVTVGSVGEYTYRYTIRHAQENMSFHLRGGDDQTDEFQLVLTERPHVVSSSATLIPPAYAKLATITLGENERAARILPGTDITISVRINKPVRLATLMAGTDVVTQATVHQEDPLQYSAQTVALESQTYHFALTDEVGFTNTRPVRFSMRIAKDEAPSVRLRIVGVSEMITPQAILPIEVEYSDTYGLASAELMYEVDGGTDKEALIPMEAFKAQAKSISTSLAWPVVMATVEPGDQLILRARASDYNNITGPNIGEAPAVSMRVVTRDELLAELSRREQEHRLDFERLVNRQERLRSDLLTVLGKLKRGDKATDIVGSLTQLERRQRTVASATNVVRQQFEQILAELVVNQLDTRDVHERLGAGIVEPLTKLTQRNLPAAADAIRVWARALDPEAASNVDPKQAVILAHMQEILEKMIQWEGYHEVVSMLRDILRLQEELRTETKQALESQADDIFDK